MELKKLRIIYGLMKSIVRIALILKLFIEIKRNCGKSVILKVTVLILIGVVILLNCGWRVKMKTHRCKGSLKAEVSIRYDYRFQLKMLRDLDYLAWRLYHYTFDGEYDCIEECHVSEIIYCPYCGEKLE